MAHRRLADALGMGGAAPRATSRAASRSTRRRRRHRRRAATSPAAARRFDEGRRAGVERRDHDPGVVDPLHAARRQLLVEPRGCENGVIRKIRLQADAGIDREDSARAARRAAAGRRRPPGRSAPASPCRARSGPASRRPRAARGGALALMPASSTRLSSAGRERRVSCRDAARVGPRRHLAREVEEGERALGRRVEHQARHAVARRFGQADVARDHGVEDACRRNAP